MRAGVTGSRIENGEISVGAKMAGGEREWGWCGETILRSSPPGVPGNNIDSNYSRPRTTPSAGDCMHAPHQTLIPIAIVIDNFKGEV